MSKSLYTIGYATKPIEVFVQQLKQYQIDVVADIRSVPYSKVFYDYHQEAIRDYLKQHAIQYVFLGEELGPRSKDDSHYDANGQVQFDRLMQSALFQQGINRLRVGVEKGLNIAMMCAEKDAATCHRSLLVGYFLARNGFNQDQQTMDIVHIAHNGNTENQQQLEQRLTQQHSVEGDLFLSPQQRQQQAYQLQLKQTSYKKI